MSTSLPARLIAVILAAGSSRRFGSIKQLAAIDGLPMVRRAVESVEAAGADALVLVAGRDATVVHRAAGAHFLIVNEQHEDGIGTSIAIAARTLAPVADGLMFCLADQPAVPPRHYAALAHSWDGSGDAVIATACKESVGPPVLFGSAHFDRLAALEGDVGARALLREAGDSLVTIRCDEAALDVDRPADLECLDQLP